MNCTILGWCNFDKIRTSLRFMHSFQSLYSCFIFFMATSWPDCSFIPFITLPKVPSPNLLPSLYFYISLNINLLNIETWNLSSFHLLVSKDKSLGAFIKLKFQDWLMKLIFSHYFVYIFLRIIFVYRCLLKPNLISQCKTSRTSNPYKIIKSRPHSLNSLPALMLLIKPHPNHPSKTS